MPQKRFDVYHWFLTLFGGLTVDEMRPEAVKIEWMFELTFIDCQTVAVTAQQSIIKKTLAKKWLHTAVKLNKRLEKSMPITEAAWITYEETSSRIWLWSAFPIELRLLLNLPCSLPAWTCARASALLKSNVFPCKFSCELMKKILILKIHLFDGLHLSGSLKWTVSK